MHGEAINKVLRIQLLCLKNLERFSWYVLLHQTASSPDKRPHKWPSSKNNIFTCSQPELYQTDFVGNDHPLPKFVHKTGYWGWNSVNYVSKEVCISISDEVTIGWVCQQQASLFSLNANIKACMFTFILPNIMPCTKYRDGNYLFNRGKTKIRHHNKKAVAWGILCARSNIEWIVQSCCQEYWKTQNYWCMQIIPPVI